MTYIKGVIYRIYRTWYSGTIFRVVLEAQTLSNSEVPRLGLDAPIELLVEEGIESRGVVFHETGMGNLPSCRVGKQSCAGGPRCRYQRAGPGGARHQKFWTDRAGSSSFLVFFQARPEFY